MKTLIYNCYVLDMVGDSPNIRKADVLINDNIIEKIEENIQIEETEKYEKINAKGMLIMPGQ